MLHNDKQRTRGYFITSLNVKTINYRAVAPVLLLLILLIPRLRQCPWLLRQCPWLLRRRARLGVRLREHTGYDYGLSKEINN